MKSIIEEIYLGEARDYEKIPVNKAHAAFNGLIEIRLKALKSELTEDQNQRIDNICEMMRGAMYEYCKEHYKAGFKRGLRLGIELGE